MNRGDRNTITRIGLCSVVSSTIGGSGRGGMAGTVAWAVAPPIYTASHFIRPAHLQPDSWLARLNAIRQGQLNWFQLLKSGM